MAESEGKLSWRTYAQDEEPEKYPLLIRIYGALGIVAGIVQIVCG